jgi:hypothetical protein
LHDGFRFGGVERVNGQGESRGKRRGDEDEFFHDLVYLVFSLLVALRAQLVATGRGKRPP